ncbi:MAG TPA: uracil-DNA glycosylase family protein [candidate division Zixibacteria bacterium]|nr:uracil-DNA glycosylase family protein [candidate division Zixibacteria bacterium]
MVPWDLGTNGQKQPPTKADIELGLTYLYRSIDLLPRIQAIVLVGTKAPKVQKKLRERYDHTRIFRCPHPSPMNLNTNPKYRGKIIETLKRVKAYLENS